MAGKNTYTNIDQTELEAKLEALSAEYEDLKARLDSSAVGCNENKRIIRDITKSSDNDYVEIRLFRDGDKYRDDVLVGINGYMCRIKRGVPVKVKRSFAKIIFESEENIAKVNADVLMKDGKMERFL